MNYRGGEVAAPPAQSRTLAGGRSLSLQFPLCCCSKGEPAEPITCVSWQPARGHIPGTWTTCKRQFIMKRSIKPLRPSPRGLLAELAPAGALHHQWTLRGYKPAGRSGDVQLPEQQLPESSLKTGRSQYRGGVMIATVGDRPFPVPHPAQDQAADKCCGCGCVLPVAVCVLVSCPGTIIISTAAPGAGSSPQPPQLH